MDGHADPTGATLILNGNRALNLPLIDRQDCEISVSRFTGLSWVNANTVDARDTFEITESCLPVNLESRVRGVNCARW